MIDINMSQLIDMEHWNAWEWENNGNQVVSYIEAQGFGTPTNEFILALCKKMHHNGWKAGKASVQGKIIGALGIRGVNLG